MEGTTVQALELSGSSSSESSSSEGSSSCPSSASSSTRERPAKRPASAIVPLPPKSGGKVCSVAMMAMCSPRATQLISATPPKVSTTPGSAISSPDPNQKRREYTRAKATAAKKEKETKHNLDIAAMTAKNFLTSLKYIATDDVSTRSGISVCKLSLALMTFISEVEEVKQESGSGSSSSTKHHKKQHHRHHHKKSSNTTEQ